MLRVLARRLLAAVGRSRVEVARSLRGTWKGVGDMTKKHFEVGLPSPLCRPPVGGIAFRQGLTVLGIIAARRGGVAAVGSRHPNCA